MGKFFVQHKVNRRLWDGKGFTEDPRRAKKYRTWKTANKACDRVIAKGFSVWFIDETELEQEI